MNLIGKILVVLIFVMSLVFMTFSVMVYSTHRNWREEITRPGGLREQLDKARLDFQAAQNEKQRLQNELATEIATRQRSVALLEQRLVELDRARKQLESNEATLTAQKQEAVAAMNASQTTLTKLRDELQTIRDQLDTARRDRDEAFNNVVKLEDQLADVTGKYDLLRKRNEELVGENTRYRLAVQDAQIQLDRNGPPRLDGVVLASRSTGYVEISLGLQDGLEKGHELDVYRLGTTVAESKYLGKVRVVQVEADRAVAQVLPEYKKGTIQKEDRVATRLY